MNIEYFKRNVFGRWRFYLKDPENRQIFFGLTKKKSLEPGDIGLLEKWGFTLTEVMDNQEEIKW